MTYNIYKKGSEYEKKIEEIIKEKANNIYEKYYSDSPENVVNDAINDKANLVKEISFILKRTLITPKRKRYLDKNYILSATDTFGADSNIFFSPNFEESLKYLSPLVALDLFEEKYLDDVNRFYAKEHLIHQEDNGIIPYFTVKELSCLYKNFALFIEDNSKSLIETGWPEYNFTDSVWLFCKLAPNYPINLPKYINNFYRNKNPHNDPYFFVKKYFLNEINQFKKYKGRTTSLPKRLSHKEIGYIEEMREKFLDLKKSVLYEITQHLFLESTDKDIWLQDCLRMLFSRFSEKDLQMIETIDNKYDQIKLFNYSLNGGLNSLIDVIIFCYKEDKFGKMNLEKNMMKSLLKGSKFAYQKNISSYYQLDQFTEDELEMNRFKNIRNQLDKELRKIDKKIAENKPYIADTIEHAKKESLNINCLIKKKYYPFIHSLIECFENGESFEISIPFLKQYPTPSHKKFIPLKLPSGTKWEHITIQFLDYDKVKIQAPNHFKRIADFRKMGFENLKNGRPNKQWELLYDLSRYRGDLSWTISTYRKKVDSHPLSTPKIRKQIQRLSESLKAYFNINEPPFYDYVKYEAYKTKFFLLPDPLNTKNLCDVTETF
ncbi:MAG TPA: hypothetical protein DCK79_08165 [Candidatus Atribacteria bacterium]|nr:hypothetical protein [Candidatus Atribacteria bacterium]